MLAWPTLLLAPLPPPRCAPLLLAEGGAGEDSEVLPQSYFSALAYDEASTPVPWDLFGRPQPPVKNAANAGDFGAGSAILDCGCGAGDNANWLAARGHDVLAFDLSASAVSTACARASDEELARAIEGAGGRVEFVEASAIDLASAARVQERARELGGFEVVLDSALLHCLDDDDQRSYVDGLRPLVREGGTLFVGCFSDANPPPWSNPRRMSEAELRALFCRSRGWELTKLSEAWYERPAARTASKGGAWTMAWWAVITPWSE